MAVITHPELIRRAVLAYRDFIKKNEIKAVENKPLTKGDSIFQRIIEPYGNRREDKTVQQLLEEMK